DIGGEVATGPGQAHGEHQQSDPRHQQPAARARHDRLSVVVAEAGTHGARGRTNSTTMRTSSAPAPAKATAPNASSTSASTTSGSAAITQKAYASHRRRRDHGELSGARPPSVALSAAQKSGCHTTSGASCAGEASRTTTGTARTTE